MEVPHSFRVNFRFISVDIEQTAHRMYTGAVWFVLFRNLIARLEPIHSRWRITPHLLYPAVLHADDRELWHARFGANRVAFCGEEKE